MAAIADERLSISGRAVAGITPMHRDPSDMGRLREEWRLLAKQWVAAQSRADEFDEGRKMLMDELTLALVKDGMPVGRAEKEARISDQFKSYMRKAHDAKREANDLRIDMKNAEMAYWERNNAEATERAERRMSR